MNGTTFPGDPGYDGGGERQSYQQNYSQGGGQSNGGNQSGGWQGNQNNGGGNGGGWQNRQGGGNGGNWQNRQGGGGGGGNWGQKKQWGGKSADDGDLSLYKPYVIAANNDVPPEILTKFDELAKWLESLDYTVRVGGMEGIEDRIEKLIGKKEVHLPWKGFNEKESRFTYNSPRAFAIAKMFSPTFDTLKKGVQIFQAKNARLIMGDKMNSPALFLLCWTEDGAESLRERTGRTGFTGHPIAIASGVGIQIFNLAKPDAEQRLKFYVESTRNVEQ